MGRHPQNELHTTARYFVGAQKGSKEEVQALIERVDRRLFRFCLFLTGNLQEARDLSQEAYVRLLEKKDTVEDPNQFLSWLFQTTKHLFLNHLRSPKNRPYADIQELPGLLALDSDKVSNFSLLETLAELSPDDRLLFLMVNLEGCTYEETATVLGNSVPSVRARLFRIRKAMKENLTTRTHRI